MNESSSLNKIERNVLVIIFSLVAILILIDVITDLREGVSPSHILIEFFIIALACIGVIVLLRNFLKNRNELRIVKVDLQRIEIEAIKWKEESQKYIKGLSAEIDKQLSRWELTPAEKEVALLLLKGLSLREIAELRSTSEKTARVQSTFIYQKSGLSGRSELSAFFLEDLLSPSEHIQGAYD